MNFLKTFLLVIITVAFTACSIEMNMMINSDYSGEMEMKIDISEMMGFMGLDSMSTEQKDSLFDSMNPENEITDADLAKLEEAGLTNFSFDVNEEFIAINYEYADVNDAYNFFFVLDTSSTEEDRERLMNTEYFKKEDTRFTINFSDDGLSDMINESISEGGEAEDDIDMSFMFNLFTMKQSYTFERPVVDVLDEDLPIRVKGNKIYFTINFTEYLDEFVGKEITVVFEEEGKKKNKKKKK